APNASPAIAAANQNAAPVEQTQSPDPAAAKSVTNPTEIWKQIATAQQPEPAAPALGPRGPPAAAAPENSEQSSAAESTESSARDKTKATASSRRSTSQSSRARTSRDEDNYGGERNYSGRHHAEVVGRTANGGLIVRLSSGRVVTLPPLNNDGIYRARPRHRAYVE